MGYFDYSINKKKLTEKQKISLKDYSRPLHWSDNVKLIQRDKHKKI